MAEWAVPIAWRAVWSAASFASIAENLAKLSDMPARLQEFNRRLGVIEIDAEMR